MRGDWSLDSIDVFAGPVPPEVFERVKGWSVRVDAPERVERVAVATRPRLALLVMTSGYLYIVFDRGFVQWCEGKPRATLHARCAGEDLFVHQGVGSEEKHFGALAPVGSAQRLAAEVHKPITVADVERAQQRGTSAADLRW